jgi:5-methylcytosine-specific restriction endonuclease McrA
VRACLSCGRVIRTGPRCPECTRAKHQRRNLNRPAGERTFYSSAAWRRLADATVAAADACATCGTSNLVAKLTAGHLRSTRGYPDLALEPSNVVAQCASCQRRMQVEPDPSKWPAWARSPRDG